MTENTIINGGSAHRIFSNVGVARVAAGTEKALEQVATEIAKSVVALLQQLDVKENKKGTARKISVQHVATIAPEPHRKDVLLASDHKVTRIQLKKKDSEEAQEAQEKPKGKKEPEKAQPKGKPKAKKESEKTPVAAEKESEPTVEMLFLALSPVRKLLKVLISEGQEEGTAPFAFTDRSVTAAQILLERRLIDFAKDAALLLSIGPNKKKPRVTITEEDVTVTMKLKQSGL